MEAYIVEEPVGSSARQISHAMPDRITFWSESRPVESIRLMPRSGLAKQLLPCHRLPQRRID